jgi:quinol-cytochrome oxidoreductase complex cytochrome b subunit
VLVLALVVATLLITLVVTGISLSNSYRPRLTGEETVEQLHRFAASVVVWAGLALVGASVGWMMSVRPRRRRVLVLPAGLAALLVLASVTGYLLPWDQLALRAVTVGGDYDGAWTAAFSDRVRFVLIDGAEISQTAYRNALVAHLGLSGLAIVAVAALLVRALRSRPG